MIDRARFRARGSPRVAIAAAMSALIGACTSGPLVARGPSAASTIVWTELGPSGLIARAITTDTTCPPMRVDDAVQAMQVRAWPAPPEFSILVCEAPLAASTRSASIDGRRLTLSNGTVRRIVVIGDAGCRIEGRQAQACNDPARWPFAEIARRAAEWRPDLVVHVGDYVYREAPCPPGNTGCAGSPHGDGWESLKADLFAPATPLLAAAPWVFLRGNHEICARGGAAWFRILSPLPMPARCVDYTDPYRISLDGLDLIVLDSAISNDFENPADQVAAYRGQFDTVRRLATRESWLLAHKPIYVFGHLGVRDGVEQLFMGQGVLQEASGNDFPATIQLLMGGHVHLFESLSFGGGRPPQLVVGNSGTQLDPPITTPLAGLVIAGRPVADGLSLARFGFMTLRATEAGWQGVLRDVAGAPLVDCAIGGGRLECRRVK